MAHRWPTFKLLKGGRETPDAPSARDTAQAELEAWVRRQFRARGYVVRRCFGEPSVLLALRPDVSVVIELGRYGQASIGEPALHALERTMRRLEAGRGCLVTGGELTASARAWVGERPIEVWERVALEQAA